MLPIKTLLFDLDGTLADTRQDLAASLNAALLNVGREPLGLDEITALIGDGAGVLLRRSLGPGADEETLEEALGFFLSHYQEHCCDQTSLYPGVKDTLAWMGNKIMAVVTNKPLRPTQSILNHLGLSSFFEVVLGGDSLPVRKPSPEPLLEALRRMNQGIQAALMVGDSPGDVEAAKAAGLKSCVVTYGYRPMEELKAAAPDFIIESFRDLAGLLH